MATLQQAQKILDCFSEKKLSTSDVQWLLESGLLSDLAESAFFETLRARVVREKVREALCLASGPAGIFTSPSLQLEMFKQWNSEHGLGFTHEDFVSLGDTPNETDEPDKPLVAWTLEAMLTDPITTFDLLARQLVKSPADGRKLQWYGTCNGLHKGVCWQPMTLRWVRIDFGANYNRNPKDVMGQRSVHAGGLWMAAYSPQWLANLNQTLNDVVIPEPSFTGFSLSYEVPGVPHLMRHKIGQQSIEHRYGSGGEHQSVPEYVQ